MFCLDQYATIGGAQRSLLDLLPAFSRRGWQPSVAAPDGGSFANAVRRHGTPFHNVNCGTYTSARKPPSEMLLYSSGLLHVTHLLERLIQEHQFRLLYVNGPRLLPHAAWIARRKGIPLIFHCHNRLVQYSAIALTKWCLRYTNTELIGCCKYAVAPFDFCIPGSRLSILYNGVPDMSMERKPSEGGLLRIGTVGRVDVEKGQLEFVRAAAIVSRRFQECRFVMVGAPTFSGTAYHARVIAAANGLPFSFAGWQENIAQVYSELDIVVVPSSATEATTRVILEAYSAGVPVVAFPSGGIPEILHDEETGFLSSGMSAEALAERIMSVLQMDKTLVKQVVRRARNEWAERFTLAAYSESVSDVLDRAAA